MKEMIFRQLFNYKRVTFFLTIFAFLYGLNALFKLPKEAMPDIDIPYVLVLASLPGISAEDSDRMLVVPLLKELESLDFVKEISSRGIQNAASIVMELYNGTEMDYATIRIREEVKKAEMNLPRDVETSVEEIDMAAFPVITLAFSSSMADQKALFDVVDSVQDRLEMLQGVLSADISGRPDDQIQLFIDQEKLYANKISVSTVTNAFSENNVLITAGQHRAYTMKVPSLLSTQDEIMAFPIVSNSEKTLRVRDLGYVEFGQEAEMDRSRVNGFKSVNIQVSKRSGFNIIDLVADIKITVESMSQDFPSGVNVFFLQDESIKVEDQFNDLLNTTLFSTILVALSVLLMLNFRAGLLVGLSIPFSFVMSLGVLYLFGISLNIIVLFALMLSIGLLVDSAIIVVEYADRLRGKGLSATEAYLGASVKMFVPIFVSTLTTIIVFFPLLKFPDIVGDIMVYIPIVVPIVLLCSFLVSMVFLPALGSMMERRKSDPSLEASKPIEMQTPDLEVDPDQLLVQSGFIRGYVRFLNHLIRHRVKVILIMVAVVVLVMSIFIRFGRGVVFFPDGAQNYLSLKVHGSSNLDLEQRSDLVRDIENAIFGANDNGLSKALGEDLSTSAIEGIRSVVTTISMIKPHDGRQDQIATLLIELTNWQERAPIDQIAQELKSLDDFFEHVDLLVEVPRDGPPKEGDISIELFLSDSNKLYQATQTMFNRLSENELFLQVQSNIPPDGLERLYYIDREKAALYGVSVYDIGAYIRMFSDNGYEVDRIILPGNKEETDVVLKVPYRNQNESIMDQHMVLADGSLLPLGNLIKSEVRKLQPDVTRQNGKLTYRLDMDLVKGVDMKEPLIAVEEAAQAVQDEFGVDWQFVGDLEDQKTAGNFIISAFMVAFVMVFVVLLIQFNSFYLAFMIMIAAFLSVVGVLFALFLRGEPFGIVMCGMATVALIGTSVNNNIVLIDEFLTMLKLGRFRSAQEIACLSAATRLRPIFLTTFTTILGISPFVFGLGIDILGGEVLLNDPSALMWVQFATSIVGGMLFSSSFVLILTPVLLSFIKISPLKASSTI